jgi:hypothetical protein
MPLAHLLDFEGEFEPGVPENPSFKHPELSQPV